MVSARHAGRGERGHDPNTSTSDGRRGSPGPRGVPRSWKGSGSSSGMRAPARSSAKHGCRVEAGGGRTSGSRAEYKAVRAGRAEGSSLPGRAILSSDRTVPDDAPVVITGSSAPDMVDPATGIARRALAATSRIAWLVDQLPNYDIFSACRRLPTTPRPPSSRPRGSTRRSDYCGSPYASAVHRGAGLHSQARPHHRRGRGRLHGAAVHHAPLFPVRSRRSRWTTTPPRPCITTRAQYPRPPHPRSERRSDVPAHAGRHPRPGKCRVPGGGRAGADGPRRGRRRFTRACRRWPTCGPVPTRPARSRPGCCSWASPRWRASMACRAASGSRTRRSTTPGVETGLRGGGPCPVGRPPVQHGRPPRPHVVRLRQGGHRRRGSWRCSTAVGRRARDERGELRPQHHQGGQPGGMFADHLHTLKRMRTTGFLPRHRRHNPAWDRGGLRHPRAAPCCGVRDILTRERAESFLARRRRPAPAGVRRMICAEFSPPQKPDARRTRHCADRAEQRLVPPARPAGLRPMRGASIRALPARSRQHYSPQAGPG